MMDFWTLVRFRLDVVQEFMFTKILEQVHGDKLLVLLAVTQLWNFISGILIKTEI